MVLKLLNNYNKRKAKTKEKKGEFELCSVEVALHQHARKKGEFELCSVEVALHQHARFVM